MAIGVWIVILVLGSLIFHYFSPWYFTPIASNWDTIDTTVDITFWVTGIVFVLVNLFMAYAVIRYRHRKGNRAAYEPENKKLETWLTVVTAIGVAAMLAPGLLVWARFVTVPEDAMIVEAIGQQWHWSFRFPGKDGALGAVDPSLISEDNPFGMDPDDPSGADDLLVANPSLHLPLGQPVKVLLRSKDVLHDFAVPQFRVKMDLVPGMVTYLWFTPTRTGEFEILCEELCGLAHHTMRGKVIVDEPEAFRGWLGEQPTYAETVAAAVGDPAAGELQFAACTACHGSEGEGNQQLNAPKLAGLDSWYIRRQLAHYKSGIRGSHQDDVFGQQMAAMANTLFNQAAVDNVVAYIATLPDRAAKPTISGDLTNGERIYATCGACHGLSGEGIWALNAPRQAGMSDWYLAAQLKHFRDGIRGTHGEDPYGPQMRMMAQTLRSDQAIDDVVAYINTLTPPPQMAQSEQVQEEQDRL